MKICCIDVGIIKQYFGMMGFFLSYRLSFMVIFVGQLSFVDVIEILLAGMMSDSFLLSCFFIPIILISALSVSFNWKTKILVAFQNIYIVSMSILFQLIACVNILHYYYLHRLVTYNTLLQLTEMKIVAKMFMEERQALFYMCCMLISVLLIYGFFLYRLLSFRKNFIKWIEPLALAFVLFVLFGFVVKFSFFHSSNSETVDVYSLLEAEKNDAKINPVLELFGTTYNNIMTDNVPRFDYAKMQSIHKLSKPNGINPIRNVVMIIMEGMQESFVNDSILTPFLNSIKSYSLYYTNAYSAGIHTAHAVFSLHTGLPAQCSHPFYDCIPRKYESSLPLMLKRHGYRSMFIMPHNRRFDNMEGFLKINGFDFVFAQDNFPKDSIVNIFGVNDACLFSDAILKIRKIERTAPVLCTLLTVSNHIPYIIPNNFPRMGLEKKYRIVKYADWALSIFFNKAEKEEWFDRTLFVLVGDHAREYSGQGIPEVEAHHVACLFYAPRYISSSKCDNIVGHVDITPTIMGYLGLPCSTRMYGIDSRIKKRRFLVMSSDKGLECIDSKCYLRYENDKHSFCKMYKSELVNNIEKHRFSLLNHLKGFCCEK